MKYQCLHYLHNFHHNIYQCALHAWTMTKKEANKNSLKQQRAAGYATWSQNPPFPSLLISPSPRTNQPSITGSSASSRETKKAEQQLRRVLHLDPCKMAFAASMACCKPSALLAPRAASSSSPSGRPRSCTGYVTTWTKLNLKEKSSLSLVYKASHLLCCIKKMDR